MPSSGGLSKIRQLQRPGSVSATPLQSPSINEGIHPLRFTWVIFFLRRAPGSKIQNYETAMKRIGAFSSIEDFWGIYTYLHPINELPTISDYHIFKAGIKPTYEDPANINGGKWQIRLRKGLSHRIWEDLMLAIAGDQFLEVGEELCGAVISSRNSEDVLSIWNKTASNGSTNLKIRNTIRKVLDLKPEVVMEYISHNERQNQSDASQLQHQTTASQHAHHQTNNHHHPQQQLQQHHNRTNNHHGNSSSNNSHHHHNHHGGTNQNSNHDRNHASSQQTPGQHVYQAGGR